MIEISRRQLISCATATALASFAPAVIAAEPRKLRILVLGGTYFLGPAIVSAAMARGHEVTLFNRGKTRPELFAALEKLRGDRTPEAPDLAALQGKREWDAVIDVWPSNPHMVAQSASLLKDRVGRYVYVSTIVAYKDLRPAAVAEDAPLFDDVTDGAAWYEFDKANSERALFGIFGDRATTLRAPILVGRYQDSDTFRFWASRIARGGDVLAPGDGSDLVQFTNTRDIGAFAVLAAENGMSGPYNVVGPARRTTMRDMLETINAACGNKADLVWAPYDVLTRNQIRAWSDLPMYVPLAHARRPGFMQVSNARVLKAGMTFTPLATTVDDELRWFREAYAPDYEFPSPKGSNKGIPRAREREVLRQLKRS